ncbi:hypothetical protein LIER_22548 [Lithospermum erythrorhizon]|uniref:RNase H type-1 domain-containing protein n=1 Tax=Lithospermum erythrorhizon TaxID=34254 RepID=A0AAV3QXC1_LITER
MDVEHRVQLIALFREFVDVFTWLPSDMPGDDETWIIQVDGASNKGRKGVGVLLHVPDGVHISYLLKLEFEAMNNVAEYDALIAGLRLALSMAAKKVVVQSGSHVVVNQVNDKCATIAEYLVMYSDRDGTLPTDKNEARHLKHETTTYALVAGELFRRSYYSETLARCIEEPMIAYVIRKRHPIQPLLWYGSSSTH